MATRTISPLGGNWSAVTAWVEAAVPTSADDVVATAASGALTIDAASSCRSIDLTGYTATLTHNAFILSVGDASGGALKFVAGMTYTKADPATSAIYLVSTSNNGGAGWAVTTAGQVFGNFRCAGLGGKWVLQDDLNTTTTATTTILAGTLDTNNKTLNLGSVNTSTSNVRTLTLGSSAINLSGTTTAAWYANNVTNLTVTANTAVLTFTATGGGFTSGVQNWNGLSLVFNSAGTQTLLPGGCTLGALTRTGTAAAGCILSVTGNVTVTGAINFTGANSTTQRLAVKSDVGGTARTITANGTVTESNVDYTDITKAGTAPWPLMAVPRHGSLVGLMRAAGI